MSYRDKTPTVISILTRKLKPGKTFLDFQKAHIPSGKAEKTEYGYDVEYFKVPTRVINAVSAEDPSVIYSIGLSYGDISEIFSEAMAKSKEDSKPGNRGDKLDEVCDDLAEPIIAFVGADNNYGGKDPDHEQASLAQVTPEVVQAIKNMKNQKGE
jgi:hypothetical protein